MNDMALQRFIDAQHGIYEVALGEIRTGKKRTHWMWFVFPQLKGLGHSATAQLYGIRDLHEAKSYLQHPVLGKRLREITDVLNNLRNDNAHEIFGHPDDLKLHSSLTLFTEVDEAPEAIFKKALTRFFGGRADAQTLRLLYGT